MAKSMHTNLDKLWKKELLAMHRWGRLSFWFNIKDNRGKNAYVQLKKLWNNAVPFGETSRKITDQIMSLEICNWKLEDSILALCRAIGRNKPADIPIGHINSMTLERWQKIWLYYLTLRNWLPREINSGYKALLNMLDPRKTTQNHVLHMLGERNKLKELYVERFCLCLEFWLGGMWAEKSTQKVAHDAAVLAIDKKIKELDPKFHVLPEAVLKNEGNGRLNPCSHKLFYRYDLIISSIGAGKWRAIMGRRATEGFERADTLEKYLSPIDAWLSGKTRASGKLKRGIAAQITRSLGKRNNIKAFLAALLVALLRPQALAARRLAETRIGKK